jgi:hypothetical protein
MCNRSYGSAVLISMASYQGESCKTGMHSPSSPDLNPIEHQWFVLKNRMRKHIQAGQPFRQVVDHAFIE